LDLEVELKIRIKNPGKKSLMQQKPYRWIVGEQKTNARRISVRKKDNTDSNIIKCDEYNYGTKK